MRRHAPNIFLAQFFRRHHLLHHCRCLQYSFSDFSKMRQHTRYITWSLKLTGLLIRYLFLLISMATFGLKLLSSSMASSSSSSLKYCSLEVDILDCILEALVDILDCILEVLVDILDPDILVLTFAVAQTPLPHPLHYRTLGCKELLSFSPLEETPPPEVVDSFPKVVSQNREGKGCGRLTFSTETSADVKVQSRKQTRTVMLVLQNDCAASATCVPWQENNFSGVAASRQSCNKPSCASQIL